MVQEFWRKYLKLNKIQTRMWFCGFIYVKQMPMSIMSVSLHTYNFRNLYFYCVSSSTNILKFIFFSYPEWKHVQEHAKLYALRKYSHRNCGPPALFCQYLHVVRVLLSRHLHNACNDLLYWKLIKLCTVNPPCRPTL